jgi:hypothetical protein
MDTEGQRRQRKILVMAYGEGQTERIFIRHLDSSYRRSHVAVKSSSAGGGGLEHMLHAAIRFRNSDKGDWAYQFILLDTDVVWSNEVQDRAKEENIILIGNGPCFEFFLLDILGFADQIQGLSSTRCKKLFEQQCRGRDFTHDECERLFTKAVLNEARQRIKKLDSILRIFEGERGVDLENLSN